MVDGKGGDSVDLVDDVDLVDGVDSSILGDSGDSAGDSGEDGLIRPNPAAAEKYRARNSEEWGEILSLAREAGPARRGKMTTEAQCRILEAVSLGAPSREFAAGCGGITRRTLHNWLEAGEKECDLEEDGGPEVGERGIFYRVFCLAESSHGMELLADLRAARKAMRFNPALWPVAMTQLARRFRDSFGERMKVEAGGKVIHEIVIQDRRDWRAVTASNADEIVEGAFKALPAGVDG